MKQGVNTATVVMQVGPSYCDLCGEWPAAMTKNGKRCHLCECKDICAEHPVAFPKDARMIRDLQSIGVRVPDAQRGG